MSQELARAESLLDLNRPGEAEQAIRAYLGQNPHEPAALRLLSQSLLEQEGFHDARMAATSAITAVPEDEHAHRLLALSFSGLQLHPEAIAAARQAVKLAPQTWQTHHTLATTMLTGRADRSAADALKHAREALRLAPNSPDVLVLVGMCHDELGQKGQAESSYREALRIQPDHPMAINNLAAMDINRGRVLRASAHLTAGLASSPQEEILQFNLAVALLRVIRWNYFITLVGGLVAVGMAKSGSEVAPRVSILIAALATTATIFGMLFRRFPRGSARWALRSVAKLGGRASYQLFLSVLAIGLLTTVCVLPVPAAEEFAKGADGFFLIGLVAGAFWALVGMRED